MRDEAAKQWHETIFHDNKTKGGVRTEFDWPQIRAGGRKQTAVCLLGDWRRHPQLELTITSLGVGGKPKEDNPQTGREK